MSSYNGPDPWDAQHQVQPLMQTVCGLRVTMMCQCRFHGCDKCLTPWGVLTVEAAVPVWGRGAVGDSIFLSVLL